MIVQRAVSAYARNARRGVVEARGALGRALADLDACAWVDVRAELRRLGYALDQIGQGYDDDDSPNRRTCAVCGSPCPLCKGR